MTNGLRRSRDLWRPCLKSHHDEFLFAEDDDGELRITQDRDGASPNARWAVELVPVPVPVPSSDGDDDADKYLFLVAQSAAACETRRACGI